MFNDITLTLTPTPALATKVVKLVDGPTNRRTVRTSEDGTQELTIAHMSSNENKGHQTQRTNIRLSQTFPVAESSDEVTGYVQITFSMPKASMTVPNVSVLVAELVNFLLHEEDSSSTDIGGADFNACVTRLYAGEP